MLKGKWPEDPEEKGKVEQIVPIFKIDGKEKWINFRYKNRSLNSTRIGLFGKGLWTF